MPLTPHSYQLNGVAQALYAPGHRWIFNDETGMGKTAQAVLALKELGLPRAIIACPAPVRRAWQAEFDTWWPGHPQVGAVVMGERKQMTKAQRAEYDEAIAAPFQIWSYSMLKRAPALSGHAVVFDEAHYLQHPSSEWSKAARAVMVGAEAAFALTATLMPNKPLDAWNLVDILWPGRFGTPQLGPKPSFKFAQRYTNATHNSYGWAYKGVNQYYQEELRLRLAAMSSRATKKQYGHLLPPFLVDSWTGSLEDWLKGALAEAEHVCILTHRRASAMGLAAQLQACGRPVLALTGAMTPEYRRKALEAHRAQPQGLLVATMHSVGIGIDLTWCTRALFAELHPRPEKLLQGIGRFSRLSGSAPSSVHLLVQPGSPEEALADKIALKLKGITALNVAGAGESQLEGALLGGQTEEDVLDGLLGKLMTGPVVDDDLLGLDEEDE